jgi:two-component system CheB/CheR fusion protein
VATERKEEDLLLKNKAPKPEASQTDFRKSADAVLLSKFTPASVVVNDQMDIVHIQGTITPFLEQPQGKPTFNLLKMTREGLAFELRNALHKAKISKEAVSKENIPATINDKQSLISFQVIPLTGTIEQHFLIVFEEKALPVLEKKSATHKTQNEDSKKRYEQLEKELSQTREDMRSITEDMEAANEELQSANEEMQSLNEELETSKEELQSINEELTIVNHEMLDKQELLNAARFYSESIVATLREPLVILNKSLRIITANASFYKKFNTEEQDVEGKVFYEIQNRQWDDETMRLLLEKILPQKEKLNDFEIIIDFPKLGKRHLLMNARQVVNEKTTEQLILLAIEDITEKVRSEKILIESEARSRAFVESNIVAVCFTQIESATIIEANDAYLNMLGYTKQELAEGKINWLNYTPPENHINEHEAIEKARSTKVSPPYEKEIIRTDGKRISVIKARAIINKDEIMSVFVEITERKAAEQKLETKRIELESKNKQIEESEREQKKMVTHLKLATDSAKVGIWSFDIVSSKLEWSSLHKIMWGYDVHREDLTYEDWHKAIEPEDKELAFQKIEEARVTNSIYEANYRITRENDGAIVWIKSTGHYHYDEFGVAHTLTGVSIDITKQKLIDEELLQAKSDAETATEKAENAVTAKQQFLSNMSHEIRTPMNAIIGFTKVLGKTDLTEKQKEYLQAIKSSGNTLIVLIDDILDLAKVDAGKMIFVNLPFKIEASINTILHLFETKIQEINVELVKEFDANIPEIVLGDAVRLHQILINLLSNAIKFTSKGKITVCVNLLTQDEEKVTLEIKITDTGIGIPQNKIATIFENFEQATNITSSLYGGTGLGLAIVKQLVEKQGGTISVDSKVNDGSTFSFTLSFQKTNAAVALENVVEHYETETQSLKVLVVEDVKLNQLLMRTILDDFKFLWDIAENGQTAIEKLQANTYDIILMDLQMPIMNGFEATEYIRNTMNLQIPIIALTADVTTVDVEKCKNVGMNDYISKPIDEKLLHSKILGLVKSK